MCTIHLRLQEVCLKTYRPAATRKLLPHHPSQIQCPHEHLNQIFGIKQWNSVVFIDKSVSSDTHQIEENVYGDRNKECRFNSRAMEQVP